NPDSISVDENVNLLAAKEITDRYNVAIGGNIPLTSIMLLGNQQDNMKFAVDLLDSIPDKRNFILAPGCDMPYNVPVENCIGVAQAAIETDVVREMVKNYQAEEIDTSNVVIPDYASLTKPLVEVFTLDSAQCAACGYMMGAANQQGDLRRQDRYDRIQVYLQGKCRSLRQDGRTEPAVHVHQR
ncbi:MAG: uroporphyrinogen decarboxylase family protein, partial [Butyricicoccus pullicaecorum]